MFQDPCCGQLFRVYRLIGPPRKVWKRAGEKGGCNGITGVTFQGLGFLSRASAGIRQRSLGEGGFEALSFRGICFKVFMGLPMVRVMALWLRVFWESCLQRGWCPVASGVFM